MKKILLIAVLLAVPAISYAQPSIKFQTETYDFGEVSTTGHLEYNFEFSNEGTDDLVIEKLTSS